MKTKKIKRLRSPAPRRADHRWQLRLYVTGETLKSVTAFANLKELCENRLKGRYRITVIDLLQKPELAKGDQILAIPTVVRKLPKPVRTVIGNLSDTAHLLAELGVVFLLFTLGLARGLAHEIERRAGPTVLRDLAHPVG